jgi:hypothetical protein
VNIPLYGSVPACLKCGASSVEMVGTVHHSGIQLSLPQTTPCVALLFAITEDAEVAVENQDLEERLASHMCRVCRRCGHGWVELSLNPFSVYDRPQGDDDGEGL